MKNRILILALSALALSSCNQSNEAQDLKDAQMCLNDAPASGAMACTDKLSGYSSADSYKLRCAAVFISEGFNSPSSFTAALSQINNPTGGCTGGSGCSPTVGAAAKLNFHSAGAGNAANNLTADKAVDYCSKSNIGIYSQIAAIFKIGTLGSVLAATPTPTPDQVKAAITAMPDADMGALATTVYTSACSNTTNASDSTQKYCTELNSCTSLSTPAAIGNCVKGKYTM